MTEHVDYYVIYSESAGDLTERLNRLAQQGYRVIPGLAVGIGGQTASFKFATIMEHVWVDEPESEETIP